VRGGGLIPIGALTLLAVASPSLAQAQQQVTASVSPNVAGAQSSVAVDVSPGAQVSSSAATPQSVILDSPQGLLYDGRSRSTRCSTQQAQSFSCPDSSRVGSGQAQFTISGPFLPPQGQQLTFLLAAFLAPPQQPGDVAGVVMQATQQGGSARRSIIGRLLHGGNPPYDLELRVDVGNVQAPPGYTARFDRLQLTIGATHTIKKVRHKRRHHRLIRIVRKIRYSLLTNPAVCTSAGWPYRLVVQYADHADTSGGSLGCAPPSG
jgi:hypothetical protein